VESAYDLDLFDFVRSDTDRAFKIPCTGAYTIVDWSYDEHYTKDTMLGAAAQRVDARQRFGIDVARPNVAGLVKAGVEVSSDRRTRRNDSSGGGAYFRRDLQRNGEDVNARARLHICFSAYNSLFSHIEDMDECYELQLP